MSRTYRPYSEIMAARQEFIKGGGKPAPKEVCNFCDYRVPRGALWCSSACAEDFDVERKELLQE